MRLNRSGRTSRKEYRARKHPIDVLVQDFLYWDPTWPWGSHQFNPATYPDPAAALAELHREHIHMPISVWGLFQQGKPGYPDRNREALEAQQDLLPEDLRGDDLRFYDAFKPAARELYWAQIRDELFRKGFDGWWLDASEPEVDMWKFRKAPTAAGPGALVLNAYPLMHTIGVSQGQLAADPNRRPVILTRSAYAGQQRTGAITWSGDITGSWQVFEKQIPAGLNFCLSGIPYWTTDIGGFFAPNYIYPAGASDPAYRELFIRWFEYGAFCPIFRVHGTDIAKEMWRFGPETEAHFRQIRPAAVPAHALHLLASLAGHTPWRHPHACAGHGLSARCGGAGAERRVSLRAVAPRLPRRPAGRDHAGTCIFPAERIGSISGPGRESREAKRSRPRRRSTRCRFSSEQVRSYRWGRTSSTWMKSRQTRLI